MGKAIFLDLSISRSNGIGHCGWCAFLVQATALRISLPPSVFTVKLCLRCVLSVCCHLPVSTCASQPPGFLWTQKSSQPVLFGTGLKCRKPIPSWPLSADISQSLVAGGDMLKLPASWVGPLCDSSSCFYKSLEHGTQLQPPPAPSHLLAAMLLSTHIPCPHCLLCACCTTLLSRNTCTGMPASSPILERTPNKPT